MDEYTRKTKDWLEKRYQKRDSEGVYLAHQPVYGFRAGHCEPFNNSKYMVTFSLMNAISHFRFDSLIDIGGAEGYKSALVKHIFGVDVKTSDLSEEACNRARELYNIPAIAGDIQELPFEDEEFDITLSSETVEHVTDLRKAARELLRISKKAVIISVPNEPEEVIEKNIEEEKEHGHIHKFRIDTFDFLKEEGNQIIVKKAASKSLRYISALIEAEEKKYGSSTLHRIYNAFVPLIRLFLGKGATAWLMKRDFKISENSENGIWVYIIIKDQNSYSEKPLRKITPYDILDFKTEILNGKK